MAISAEEGARKLQDLLYGAGASTQSLVLVTPEISSPGPQSCPLGVTPPAILEEKRQIALVKKQAEADRPSRKRKRTAWNKKPPAPVTCPCGVVFYVHPPYLAKVVQYHDQGCRQKYGYSGKFGKFTPEQDARIARVYREQTGMKMGEAPVRALAEEFNLPRWKVSKRAAQLGLVARAKYAPERAWSEAEIEILKANAGFTIQRIWVKLRAAGFKRTQNGITLKLKRLFGFKPREGYTATELAGLFGIDGHSVTRWIEMGLLKAERRGTSRHSSQGGDTFLVREADVRSFVIENVAIIDFRKLDKYWAVELLAGPVASHDGP